MEDKNTSLPEREAFLELLQDAEAAFARAALSSDLKEVFEALASRAIDFVSMCDAVTIMNGLHEASYANAVAEQARLFPKGIQRESYIDEIYDQYQPMLFAIVASKTPDDRDSVLEKRLQVLADRSRALAHRKSSQ